jgi:hypothetical protein
MTAFPGVLWSLTSQALAFCFRTSFFLYCIIAHFVFYPFSSPGLQLDGIRGLASWGTCEMGRTVASVKHHHPIRGFHKRNKDI